MGWREYAVAMGAVFAVLLLGTWGSRVRKKRHRNWGLRPRDDR